MEQLEELPEECPAQRVGETSQIFAFAVVGENLSR